MGGRGLDPAQYRDRWRAVLNSVMNFRALLVAWWVAVYESEKLLCTVMFVNKELGKFGYKKDGTSALGNLGWKWR
jgi:hypothetical protein